MLMEAHSQYQNHDEIVGAKAVNNKEKRRWRAEIKDAWTFDGS